MIFLNRRHTVKSIGALTNPRLFYLRLNRRQGSVGGYAIYLNMQDGPITRRASRLNIMAR